MFHRIRRQVKELRDAQHRYVEPSARRQDQLPSRSGRPQAEPEHSEPGAVVDDFLPPELRVPGDDQLEGKMMPWQQPLVLDDEIVACTECGAYRNWLVLSTRSQIWLRCHKGHQQRETRLDTAWYNRSSGPTDALHATFDDCLRHLGG